MSSSGIPLMTTPEKSRRPPAQRESGFLYLHSPSSPMPGTNFYSPGPLLTSSPLTFSPVAKLSGPAGAAGSHSLSSAASAQRASSAGAAGASAAAGGSAAITPGGVGYQLPPAGPNIWDSPPGSAFGAVVSVTPAGLASEPSTLQSHGVLPSPTLAFQSPLLSLTPGEPTTASNAGTGGGPASSATSTNSGAAQSAALRSPHNTHHSQLKAQLQLQLQQHLQPHAGPFGHMGSGSGGLSAAHDSGLHQGLSFLETGESSDRSNDSTGPARFIDYSPQKKDRRFSDSVCVLARARTSVLLDFFH